MKSPTFSVVVPAYNRAAELSELLESVSRQTMPPGEVLVCEDRSPERLAIREVCESYRSRLSQLGTTLTYVENAENLGYDKNLRKCIESASNDWALILGNDDLLLPNAISELRKYLQANHVDFVSRCFLRFRDSVDDPIGISRLSGSDVVFDQRNSKPRMIFRAAGFVGGLAVRVGFAKELTTERFDGSLYYQIYLAAYAYCRNGIGYISSPLVGGRADNPPMFGSSDDDRGVHVPGSYTAAGRARMWKGVLDIAEHVGASCGCNLTDDLRRELTVRQSFHVFEMNAKSSRRELRALRRALSELGLFSHPLPRALYQLDYWLGRRATPLYSLCRKIMQ